MNIKKYFSPDELIATFKDVLHRFPFSLCYMWLLSIWLIILELDYFEVSTILCQAVSWPLTEGLLLSLVVTIWSDFLGKSTWQRAIQIGVVAFVIIDFIFLMVRGSITGSSELLGRSAVVTALCIAIVFLPKAPGLTRKALWQYSLVQITVLLESYLLAIVLSLAILIIYGTISVLFGFESWKALSISLIVLAANIPYIFYLNRIPGKAEISDHSRIIPGSLVGAFCKNVLLPIVGVYALILYVYAFKIILQWKLPTDSISIMVSALLCASLIMLYGLHRYDFDDTAKKSARKMASLSRSILPLVMLPLLVLMTIGVVYRVGEYGITTSRLYVLTFNLWAYCIIFYLIFKKKANLNIIATSFALVFVAVSIVPGFNLNRMADRYVEGAIRRTLQQAGVQQLPLDEDGLKEVLLQLPPQEGRNLISRLEYLDSWTDHSGVKEFVESESMITESKYNVDELTGNKVQPEYGSRSSDCIVSIPQGYSTVSYHQGETVSFEIDIDSVFRAHPEDMEPITLGLNDSTKVVICKISRRKSYPDSCKVWTTYYEFKK